MGGRPAVQYVITGTSEGINAVSWQTMVEGEHSYFQVVGWTVPSRRAEAEATILEVINTCRVL
ncbi:MAG TPA: hypothetical protein VFV67_29025 [Actinophytocola sp.]|uniref:hypothetical protein n=1 Tax=Actinophytocola sp. TaxID=1872138 RepID=UPI002DBC99FE|nr:hypothetical protein [Actinophytocola sp.]HEU5474709.1 hypothetical protein [Actinophytocola sp.]